MTAAEIEIEENEEGETVNINVAGTGDDQGLRMADEEKEM